MARNTVTQAELNELRERLTDLSQDFHRLGQRLQQDYLRPLDGVAQAINALTTLQVGLLEIQAGLAIRLALQEQQAELRTTLAKESA